MSAESAETLAGSPAEREKLSRFLYENGLYVYTVNAFVYGEFKGQTVKEQVYEPDWRTEERVCYTINVADLLGDVARLVMPSIQTPPMGFRGRVSSSDVVDAFTCNVLRVAAHLVDIERITGKTINLAIEPEPHCFLETTDEAIEYFSSHIHGVLR